MAEKETEEERKRRKKGSTRGDPMVTLSEQESLNTLDILFRV